MEHITMQHGQPCNYMRTTNQEFEIISEFFKGMGIETRKTRMDTKNCEWQARNGYKDWGCIAPPNVGGKWIAERVESDIKSGHWRR